MTTDPQTSTAPRRPPGRYDEPKAVSRPVLIAGAVVLIGVLIGIAYIAFTYYSGTRIPFEQDSYRVNSDTSITVTFSVTRGDDQTVECQLQARDRDQAEVGTLLVTIPPGDAGTVATTSTITTTRRADGAEVLSCRPVASTR